MKVILLALGFMVVFEGIFPLVAPELWQRSLERIAQISPETIRRAAMVIDDSDLIDGLQQRR